MQDALIVRPVQGRRTRPQGTRSASGLSGDGSGWSPLVRIASNTAWPCGSRCPSWASCGVRLQRLSGWSCESNNVRRQRRQEVFLQSQLGQRRSVEAKSPAQQGQEMPFIRQVQGRRSPPAPAMSTAVSRLSLAGRGLARMASWSNPAGPASRCSPWWAGCTGAAVVRWTGSPTAAGRRSPDTGCVSEALPRRSRVVSVGQVVEHVLGQRRQGVVRQGVVRQGVVRQVQGGQAGQPVRNPPTPGP